MIISSIKTTKWHTLFLMSVLCCVLVCVLCVELFFGSGKMNYYNLRVAPCKLNRFSKAMLSSPESSFSLPSTYIHNKKVNYAESLASRFSKLWRDFIYFFGIDKAQTFIYIVKKIVRERERERENIQDPRTTPQLCMIVV